MNRNVMNRLSFAAFALLLVLTTTGGCSGESGGTVVSTGLKAQFTADGAPKDNSISLQPGGAAPSPDEVVVKVVLQYVPYLSGAAVKIQFQTATTQFVSGDATGTILPGILPPGGQCAKLFAAGVVEVSVAQEGPAAGIPMTPGQQGTLCTLTFKAIAPTANGTLTILNDPQDLDVTSCPTAGGACDSVPVDVVNGVITAQQ